MYMLILASSSPRRRELLQQIGADFTVCPGTYDEDVPGRDNPEKFVHTQAVGKAASVAALYPHAWVVGADTIVAANGKILGKPRSEAEAVQMLRNLSGKGHDVYTGIALQCGESVYSHVEKTSVFFRPLGEAEIAAYVATGEPMDKAGSYGIQGRGAVFVEKIVGDYTNVVGLPLCALFVLMHKAGIRL